MLNSDMTVDKRMFGLYKVEQNTQNKVIDRKRKVKLGKKRKK